MRRGGENQAVELKSGMTEIGMGSSVQPRDRRRSSISLLALPMDPGGPDMMGASVSFGDDMVEFNEENVQIDYHGLYIEGKNVSEVKQDDLRFICELGRGACSVVKKAQHIETRELYAVKVFNVFDRGQRAQLLKEIKMLWGMEDWCCPSLIGFHGGYLRVNSAALNSSPPPLPSYPCTHRHHHLICGASSRRLADTQSPINVRSYR
ncbi:unnamed protein product [Choristocarpus tenellus]